MLKKQTKSEKDTQINLQQQLKNDGRNKYKMKHLKVKHIECSIGELYVWKNLFFEFIVVGYVFCV